MGVVARVQVVMATVAIEVAETELAAGVTAEAAAAAGVTVVVAMTVVVMGAAEVVAAVMAEAVTVAVETAVAGWPWWRCCRLPPPRRDDPCSAVGEAPVKYYN